MKSALAIFEAIINVRTNTTKIVFFILSPFKSNVIHVRKDAQKYLTMLVFTKNLLIERYLDFLLQKSLLDANNAT